MMVLTVTLHPAVDKFVRTSRLIPDGICRVEIVSIYAGGKGNNAARALVRLGTPVIATGYVGGWTGALIDESLLGEGIPTDFVKCKSQIRVSTLIQEQDTGHTYAIYEPGQLVDDQEIQELLDKFDRLLDQTSVCLLCGSGQTEALSSVYARMIEIAKKKKVRCLLDSSGSALVKGVAARPFMVKVNKEELSDYFHVDLNTKQAQIKAILRLQATGIDIVAISRGKDGLIATDGKEIWEAKLIMPEVVNVVGCGDSLLAGVAKALMEYSDLSEIVRMGVACGTANTQVNGAGFIDLDQVNLLLPQVEVKKIEMH